MAMDKYMNDTEESINHHMKTREKWTVRNSRPRWRTPMLSIKFTGYIHTILYTHLHKYDNLKS